MTSKRTRSSRNQTISLCDDELSALDRLVSSGDPLPGDLLDTVLCNEYEAVLPSIMDASVDLLILDPPYNLTKLFNGVRYSQTSVTGYAEYLDKLLCDMKPKLKQTASVYICGDWYSSTSIYAAAEKHFLVKNRITWEREKGRGARANWKNCSEDIWFCTVSKQYTFNPDSVKTRRPVIAPYTDRGEPKDWVLSVSGNYRDTAPSNLMTDITVPFWSMPENTDHPAQKSEKLMAKLILASSNEGDIVLDPFMGSGTTAVVCQKLNRRFIGIERDKEYCLLAQKRLLAAEKNRSIQGYSDHVFWARNTLRQQRAPNKPV